MFDLLEEQVLIQDVPNAFTLEVDRGEVQFENVHFAYPNGTEVLRGISFTCPAGKTVAIVGCDQVLLYFYSSCNPSPPKKIRFVFVSSKAVS